MAKIGRGNVVMIIMLLVVSIIIYYYMNTVIQHLSEMMLFLNYRIFSDSADVLVRCSGKL